MTIAGAVAADAVVPRAAAERGARPAAATSGPAGDRLCDRPQQVVEQAYFGDGEVTGPITSPAFEYDATEGLPCEPPDPEAAR